MGRVLKKSGFDWIGDIPADWQVTRLGGLYSLRNTKVNDEDYPPLSVTMQGILPQLDTAAKTNDHSNRKLVKKGDFAINSRSDRRGSCGISSLDGSVSLINTVLTPLEDMDPEYYNFLFHTTQFADEFYKWGHGIVDDLWTTGWQEMKKINVPVPSLSEQATIADFLNQKCAVVDELSATIQSQIDMLEQYKRSVITEAVTKGLDRNVEMKESGIEWIGKIPANWKIGKVKYYYSLTLGKMLCTTRLNFLYSLEPYYSAIDVHFDGVNVPDKTMWFTQAEKNIYEVKNGDVLIVEGGAGAGGCALVTEQNVPTYMQNSIIRARGKSGHDNRYLCYWIESIVRRGYIGYISNIATIPHFTKEKIGEVPIPVAPIQEETRIVVYLNKKCSEINSIIKAKQNHLKILESFKKSLIYEYVTGKKEVPV